KELSFSITSVTLPVTSTALPTYFLSAVGSSSSNSAINSLAATKYSGFATEACGLLNTSTTAAIPNKNTAPAPHTNFFTIALLLVLECTVINPARNLINLLPGKCTFIRHGTIASQFLDIRRVVFNVLEYPEVGKLVAIMTIVNGAG